MTTLRIATRSSALALWQANTIGQMLDVNYELVELTTTGDADQDAPISQLGGVGAFATEVQNAVLEKKADIAVHSAKDLQAITPDGLTLASIPLRGDVRDVLIGSTLQSLDYGATVGTGAQRRRAQLSIIRPDLQFVELRGNIDTRLEKAKNFDAIVLASAALERLQKQEHITEILSIDVMLPQVAQGALAVETRVDDLISTEIVQNINDMDAYRCVLAERSFLSELGGGCTIPCAAYATVTGGNNIYLRTLLADPKGVKVARSQMSGNDPQEVGRQAARELLDNNGGKEIMEMVLQ